jgi:EmrB/QacA subfamily drug resistance transporter
VTRLRSNPWVSLILLSVGFFMILLDTTIVNIAIPSIIDELRASLDQILWVLNAYVLAFAILLITMGRLGDVYGQRNLFVAGLVLFTAASAACGAAQGIDQLIAARVVQGVGAAMLSPQTLSIVTSIFPPERRGAAFGIWSAVNALAIIAGPVAGGFLVSYASWRWIFLVNVPIGLLIIILSSLFIPDRRAEHGSRSFDVLGVGVSAISLFLITFGLIEGQRFDWGRISSFAGINLPSFVTIFLVIATGIWLLALFFLIDLHSRHPLVPLTLFRDRNYTLMNWLMIAVNFSTVGLLLPLVIYLQSVVGMTAIQAGLTLLPMSLVLLPVAPVAGRFTDRFGGRSILLFGLACFSVGIWLLTLAAQTDSHWYDFAAALAIIGLGLGCVFPPLTTVAMRNVDVRMAGAASGIFNTTRQLGGVLGGAVVGAVLQNRLGTTLHDQAVLRSASLPESIRRQFIEGFSGAAKDGLSVGRGQVGGMVDLPPGLPPELVAQITRAAHDVFAYGYVDAMRSTLLVPAGVLLVAALSCLFVRSHVRAKRAELAHSRRAVG